MNQPFQHLPSAINLAKLARELASDIFEPKDIAKAHGLSSDQLEAIIVLPEFQKMLAGMMQDWNSAGNTQERVKVKAASAVEAALQVFYTDMTDRSIPLVQRVDALKAMMKLGELGEKDALGNGVLGGVTINIGLGSPGDGKPPQMVMIDAIAVTPEENPALQPG